MNSLNRLPTIKILSLKYSCNTADCTKAVYILVHLCIYKYNLLVIKSTAHMSVENATLLKVGQHDQRQSDSPSATARIFEVMVRGQSKNLVQYLRNLNSQAENRHTKSSVNLSTDVRCVELFSIFVRFFVIFLKGFRKLPNHYSSFLALF